MPADHSAAEEPRPLRSEAVEAPAVVIEPSGDSRWPSAGSGSSPSGSGSMSEP